MSSVPTLKSHRVFLSSITESDFYALHKIMLDDDVKRFMPDFYDVIESKEDYFEILNSFGILWERKEAAIWGIHNEDSLIGFIGLMDITTDATIFYSIVKDYRNNGFAKEAVKTLIDYMALSEVAPKIQSYVAIDNLASIKVLIHNGFEEILRTDEIIIFSKNL